MLVKRRGGTVSLALVVKSLGRISTATDKTAAELAIQRLHRRVDRLRTPVAGHQSAIATGEEQRRSETISIDILSKGLERSIRSVVIFRLGFLIGAVLFFVSLFMLRNGSALTFWISSVVGVIVLFFLFANWMDETKPNENSSSPDWSAP